MENSAVNYENSAVNYSEEAYIQLEGKNYMMDSMGSFVPVENVREVDKLRDEVVRSIVRRFKTEQSVMRSLKENAMGDLAAFLELSMSRYNVKPRGEKGNKTYLSYDGKFKVTRSIQDNMSFDEGLEAAKELIGQCLDDWTRESRPELRALVDRAFRPNKEGEVSIHAILALRRLEIEDERWKRAMHAIGESLQVVFSKAYIRVHERNAQGGWDHISLNFSEL